MTEGEFPSGIRRPPTRLGRTRDRPRHHPNPAPSNVEAPSTRCTALRAPPSPTSPAGRCPCATQRPRRAPRGAHVGGPLRPLAHGRDRRCSAPRPARRARLRARRPALGDPARPGEVLAPARRGRRHHRRPRRLPHRRRPLHGRRERRRTRPSSPRSSARRAAGFDTIVSDESDDIALIAAAGPRRPRGAPADAGLRRSRATATTTTTSSRTLDELKYYRAIAAHVRGRARARRPHRLHRRGRLRALRRPRARRRPLGRAPRDRRPHGSCPPASRAATRSASRRACRSTATSSSRDILPAQAGLGRVVALAKEGDFVGRAAHRAGSGDGCPGARRPRRGGPPRRPRRLRGVRRRGCGCRARRRHHERRALADARPPDRDGLRRARMPPSRAASSTSTCAERASRHPSSPCPSTSDPPDRRRPPTTARTDRPHRRPRGEPHDRPDRLQYTEEHEWVLVDGDTAHDRHHRLRRREARRRRLRRPARRGHRDHRRQRRRRDRVDEVRRRALRARRRRGRRGPTRPSSTRPSSSTATRSARAGSSRSPSAPSPSSSATPSTAPSSASKDPRPMNTSSAFDADAFGRRHIGTDPARPRVRCSPPSATTRSTRS